MKSTVDKLEGLSRKINVEIPADKVQQAFDKVYKAIQKKANIKGFRQGKAPITTIKSMYGEQVKSDVVNDLVNEAYSSALEQNSLEPVGYPKISFQGIEEGKGFNFSAEFEVRPAVEVKKFEGLAVMKEKLEIPEDRIGSILENIRTGQAETVTVFEDRALHDGDVAVIDFVGTVGGQPLPNGSAQGHELEIGAKQFIEGFEEGLVGMNRRVAHVEFEVPRGLSRGFFERRARDVRSQAHRHQEKSFAGAQRRVGQEGRRIPNVGRLENAHPPGHDRG